MDVEYYVTASGKSPFLEWFDGLDDKSQHVVDEYIIKFAERGIKTHVRHLSGKIHEIKIRYKAMRVYFVQTDKVILLLGGFKGSQQRDIRAVKRYWSDYVGKK